ncbi:coiled-coil domain-containing protein [Brachionus plicatilis]|uniref:Coiled-coil domain-containing protein n=1 Tax=Brachionus plicatilis TaxID=10195 RepID=A0A3M7S1S2_BRAPC|nr:coiled-coil domain-containing protein [Brachionus plicatilis]
MSHSTTTDLEEINQILNKELNSLFKYLQGVCHIWDLHEIGLVKKERALQELLQDCRRDHDNENQKKEEKLDSILDQMRESSNEKDLKNVSQQLDVIKNGYFTFRDSQMELLKQYPIMVKDELDKYEEALFKFFSITKDLAQQEMAQDQNELETFRSILKEVLSTERGNKFYIMMRSSTTPEDDLVENDILNLDELIPNTKQDFLNEIRNKNYLKNSFIPLEIFKEIKNSIRMNFLNHLENWIDEANLRSNTIVAAKSAEIDKELELRIHLHEPRIKRVEMDVHNVRAAELIMHEERVERHCAGVQEAIDNMQKQFLSLQQNLIDKANQNKSAVLNLEIAFNNATKSLRLTNLQDQLNKQKDRHIDDVKTTLRNFRAKFDDTLSFLRNSNAKFRFSFNVFSDGGNFSAEEIDLHKRKLEKMALLIDNNETSMLKEMEKLEKKHLDEAIKVMTQFQEKFKYNLIDLQFIEKIGRWLNNTQIKIKSSVNESNASAKELNSLIEEFDVWIDACKHPNLDKKNVSPKDLIEFFEKINKQIYDRAVFLKCFKEETQVPLRFTKVEKLTETDAKYEEAEKEKSESPVNKQEKKTSDKKSKTRKTANLVVPETPEQDQRSVITKSKSNILMTTSMLKSGSKVAISDDPALDIMKTILNNCQFY